MGEDDGLPCKKNRKREGKKEHPAHSIIDSQSVKTVYVSEDRGIDGGKKIKGRKRHIVVDTCGNILSVCVHAANIHDTKSGGNVFEKAKKKYRSIKGVCGDAGYRKTFVNFAKNLVGTVEIVEKGEKGWVALPKRWIVERTISWLSHSRRLSKDYEVLTKSAESMVMISHLATLLRRF